MKLLRRLFSKYLAVPLVVVLFLLAQQVYADRLKDMASVAGVRNNQLVGYGLVVGLDGTGDKTPFTKQTFRNMMIQFGIVIPANVGISDFIAFSFEQMTEATLVDKTC